MKLGRFWLFVVLAYFAGLGTATWMVTFGSDHGTDTPTATPAPCPCVERFRPGAWDCSGAVEWMPADAAEVTP